ncbi:RBBP9/YdeN family alpha/beta hydrolase [Pseudomonas syringae]|uniref:RBBP9/YdeN family alpha/beta hydrolase n=1 Tax=Pseudomonas syringae TaxID=317 RepID=UPI0009B54E91|nr:alpha/beta hydrolase [Pseudomonas syringae]
MTDVRVLILPGRGNSGEGHWQTHWQNNNPSYERVLQKEWQNPDLEDWVNTLQAVISENDDPVVLIAHSLSVILVAHWAKRYSGPVLAALLVAPSDIEAPDYPPGIRGFSPLPLKLLPFKTVVVASTNDPKVSLPRAQHFADAWGARLEIAGAVHRSELSLKRIHGRIGGKPVNQFISIEPRSIEPKLTDIALL